MEKQIIDNIPLQQHRYFLLECLERFSNIEVTCFGNETFFDVHEHTGFNPIRVDTTYRDHLIELCDKQEFPTITVDEFHVAYIVIRAEEDVSKPVYFFVGPMSLTPMDKVNLHRFYREHGEKHAEEKPLTVISTARLILLAQMAAGLVLQKQFTEDQLITGNNLQEFTDMSSFTQKLHFSMQQEEQDYYHHTYQDERKLLDCVRNGQTKEALRLNLAMDDATGSMAQNPLEQTRKLVIVAITLNTRAAIEGGIPPYEAYQISDYYMQKMDQCSTELELIACKNEAIRVLSDRVHKHLTERKMSNYVESCVSYINRHYREHIYLEDLAEKTGITPTYLSRLFSQEMDMTFQEYVLKVRVDRAANLLTYSDSSISEIGDYVNFPNQSYFGRIFKKYKGITPKAYRDRYKPREFDENDL